MPRYETELDDLSRLALQNFSYSRMSTFDKCPLRYFYHYILKLPESYGNPALLGNIIHQALEDTVKHDEVVDPKELHSNYRNAIKSYDPDRKIPPSMINDGSEMLSEFVKANPGKQVVYQNELEFSFVIGRGRFKGYIDNVAEYKNYVRISDYKCITDKTRFWRADGTECWFVDLSVGDEIIGWSETDHTLTTTKVQEIQDNGMASTVVVVTSNGRQLRVTKNHPIMTADGWLEAGQLEARDKIVIGSNLLSLHQAAKEETLPEDSLLVEFMTEGPFESYLLYSDDLMKSGAETWMHLINRLFNGKFRRTLLNSTVAQNVQTILAYLGINSRTSYNMDSWIVSIDPESKLDFYGLTAKSVYPKPKTLYDEVISVEFTGREQTWGVTVDGDHTHITDGLVTHNSGKWEVAKKNIPTDLQLGIYALYAKKIFPQKDIYAELYYLRSGKRKGHKFTNEDLNQIEKNIERKVMTILTTEDFKPTQNKYDCRWCSYAADGTCAIGGRRLKEQGLLM